MADALLQRGLPFSAAPAAAMKNGGQSGDCRRIQEKPMLNVAEKPVAGKTDPVDLAGYVVDSEQRKAALWLDEQVKASQRKVTSQVVELTPALAEVLLERNPENRKISDTFVDAYARDIRHDAWRLNGEPIIVSKDGRLNDGQHRCAAVIMAEKPITVTFVVGVERETRSTLDQGKTRTAGDYLSMNGYTDTNILAAAGGLVWQHKTRGALSSSGREKATKAEVMELIESSPALIQSLKFVSRKGAEAAGGRSMLAFCHFTFSGIDAKAADNFIISLTGGAGLLSRDPILYARNRLITGRGRLRVNDKAELIFRAWNAHRRGDSIRTFPILGGALPVLEA